jgi:uncharacterized protein YozE (UPF0346 family)
VKYDFHEISSNLVEIGHFTPDLSAFCVVWFGWVVQGMQAEAQLQPA